MKSIFETKSLSSNFDCGFQLFDLRNDLIAEYDDGVFKTMLFGFLHKGVIDLPNNYTHFGVVIEGKIKIITEERIRNLESGDFFSVKGKATIKSFGKGMISSAFGYLGLNVFGGPIEDVGRLRYIDGCTDTLLVPPIRLGDPCFNHLHFPSGIIQTPHTHPSVRTGVVLRGAGICRVFTNCGKKYTYPLVPGYAFVIETETLHSFDTEEKSLDIIAFHPDSDTGMTDDDHPMVNRTIVGGISASELDVIRTK